MQRVVRGIKVQHEFLGRNGVRGNKLVHEKFMKFHSGGTIGEVLEAAERCTAGESLIPFYSCLNQ